MRVHPSEKSNVSGRKKENENKTGIIGKQKFRSTESTLTSIGKYNIKDSKRKVLLL